MVLTKIIRGFINELQAETLLNARKKAFRKVFLSNK